MLLLVSRQLGPVQFIPTEPYSKIGWEGCTQKHCDIAVLPEHLEMPLDQFILEHLAPAAAVFADALSKSGARFTYELVLPKAFESARNSYNGLSMRAIIDRAGEMDSRRVIRIRFDVLYSAQRSAEAA